MTSLKSCPLCFRTGRESVDFDLTYPDVIIAKFALPTIEGTEPLFEPFDLTSVILKGTLYLGNNDM